MENRRRSMDYLPSRHSTNQINKMLGGKERVEDVFNKENENKSWFQSDYNNTRQQRRFSMSNMSEVKHIEPSPFLLKNFSPHKELKGLPNRSNGSLDELIQLSDSSKASCSNTKNDSTPDLTRLNNHKRRPSILETDSEKPVWTTEVITSGNNLRRESIGSLDINGFQQRYNDEHLPKYSEQEYQDGVKYARDEMENRMNLKFKAVQDSFDEMKKKEMVLLEEIEMYKSKISSIGSNSRNYKPSEIDLNEEIGFLRTQNLAMKNQLQLLENEKQNATQKTLECNDSWEKQFQLWTQTQESKYQEILSQRCHEWHHQMALLQEEFGKRERSWHEEKQNFERQLSKHEEAVEVAVQEAKKRVYDKARAQFEVGNQEYNKLRLQYQEISNERDRMSQQIILMKSEHEGIIASQKIAQDQKQIDFIRHWISQAEHMLEEIREKRESPNLFIGRSSLSGRMSVNISNSSKDLSSIELTQKWEKVFQEIQKEIRHWKESAMTTQKLVVDGQSKERNLRDQYQQLEDRALSAESLAASLKKEVEGMKIDLDHSLKAVARLTKELQQSESQCRSCETTRADMEQKLIHSQARISQLRNMNAELLGMLENASNSHGNQKQKSDEFESY